LWHEVPFGDQKLVTLGVAGELDHLHPIKQGRRNRGKRVGRGDEQDAREIKRNLDVVVAEGAVLLRVEYLEQCRRGVTPEIGAKLVDLVEHEDRVARASAAKALQNAPRHGPDVGTTVASNLGLIPHTSERRADELSPHGAGDRAAEG